MSRIYYPSSHTTEHCTGSHKQSHNNEEIQKEARAEQAGRVTGADTPTCRPDKSRTEQLADAAGIRCAFKYMIMWT